jgi:hypothetical protein
MEMKRHLKKALPPPPPSSPTPPPPTNLKVQQYFLHLWAHSGPKKYLFFTFSKEIIIGKLNSFDKNGRTQACSKID